MYQDMNQYLGWLQQCIQTQEARIAALEAAVQKMKDEMKQMDEKKTIHVDRIEYKFDQLKVETLEGTLTIGLNPNDLSGIEDFAVQNQSLNTPLSPKVQMQRSMKIEEAIYRYLESDLPQIIEQVQRELALEPNESYLSFIKDDIVKQLPNRIDSHLKASMANNRSVDEQTADAHIIELLKSEIQNGVSIFFNQLPENMRGMNNQ